ncbi:lysophospholipase [Lachnospiraceae bacterium KM106-2]|nr:lysophospholipase [Lachnospiraceae bacterium KM106-2]
MEQVTIRSYVDQLPLSVLISQPKTPKAIVQILHGMCEHKERYLPFMEYLTEQGYVCIIHDHRGHGKSVLRQEDLGYFYQDGARALVEDANQVSRYVRKRYRGLPLYLFGHSMGSLIARVYVKNYDSVVNGLILCGSPSNNRMAGVGTVLAKLVGKLRDDHNPGQWFQKMACGKYNKDITDAKSRNQWICTDEKVVEKYDQDPLCNFIFTINGFENLFKLVHRVYSKYGWTVSNPGMPVWFISGEHDPCMVGEKQLKQAAAFMEQVGYQHVSWKIYKGMRHEILNEQRHKIVFQDIAEKLEIWYDRKNLSKNNYS